MNKIQLLGLAAILMLAAPVFAEPGSSSESESATAAANEIPQPAQKPGGTEFNFVDSPGVYWVNKGFNDTIFGVNPGSFNEARHEERQQRDDDIINKLTKRTTVVEVIYQGKVLDQGVTPLKIEGRTPERPH